MSELQRLRILQELEGSERNLSAAGNIESTQPNVSKHFEGFLGDGQRYPLRYIARLNWLINGRKGLSVQRVAKPIRFIPDRL
jgi:hypothetical protein